MASLFRSPFAAVPSSTAAATTHQSFSGASTGLLPQWGWTVAAVVLALLALEQGVYRRKKRHLPGPGFTIPLIGKFMDSMNPSIEAYKRQWNSGALSVVSVFNIFIVMASTNEYSRKIFNSPTHTEPCLVQSMKTILGSDSWVFLIGKAHVDFRKGLNTLFTRQALEMYTGVMDSITRKHIDRWLKEHAADPSAKPIMLPARAMNMETSLRVFCGPHITEEGVVEINNKYWDITLALELVNFPFAVPGTKVYRAKQASLAAHRHLEAAIILARQSVAAGNEPECMVEQWIYDFTRPGYKGRSDFSNLEMAKVVFSFLFASQDAMSSSIIYGFQHLVDHPEVMTKVREEQARIRRGDYSKPITMAQLEEMPYLRATVRESMRVKPPVTMVPYTATKDFPISPDYTVPAGSMVIPSIYPSLHDESVYPEPDEFKPERWLDEKGSANANPKNYLVFGAGPHRCIGESYAASNTAIVLANAAVLMNWEHVLTPQSNEVEMIATIFPKDGCLMKFSPRE